MGVKYFVDENLIPKDGSREIISKFNKEVDFDHNEIFIYPDVHYKRGARVVNGMLISSDKHVFPACLGVDNCGFTFGKINNTNELEVQTSFENYSKLLKDYVAFENYSEEYMYDLFTKYLEIDFIKNSSLYNFLNIKTIDKAIKLAKNTLSDKIMALARQSLGSLGGGNHFFEIHGIIEIFEDNIVFNKGDYIFILHSDSVGVGDHINLLYSNLSEWFFLKGYEGFKKRFSFRFYQILCFALRGLVSFETFKLLYSQTDYRTIKAYSRIGKSLIFAHNLASLFGEMNRDLIIKNWAKTQNLDVKIISSFSHDGIRIENINRIVHRNGVQFLGDAKYFVLPSAMGGFSYIMENSFNKSAFYSSNHGVGRTQDKHIARENYNEKDTCMDLEEGRVKLYRVGAGSMAEQNKKAFKDTQSIIDSMNKYKLGKKIARTKPIAIIKG
ncbi:MAG: RtcB family protein [Endomicrobium sp.]|jgi:RNA-splicing ligase RtcB|nr:RtcB family protein [Endomicrobium sp.]